jgi:hypothetical protein
MGFQEISTEVSLFFINIAYKVYFKVAYAVLRLFFPQVKAYLSKRMKRVKVLNDRIYIRAALEGDVGVYESYMDGDWTVDDLVATISKSLRSKKIKEGLHPLTWTLRYFNLQSRDRAWQVGQDHYDIGRI